MISKYDYSLLFTLFYLLQLQLQPKEITDIRDFLSKAKRADAKLVKIKKATKKNPITKFKIRCARFVYTYRCADSQKADMLAQSLPPVLPRKDI